MPAFYAHYKFGQTVLKELPDDLQAQIRRYQELFDIGLQGPDILFFYRPLRKQPIGRMGLDIHHADGRVLFENTAETVRSSLDREAMMVYGIGVACHFASDAACHPFILRYEKQSGISHHEIEKELEKYLMREDGIDPFTYDCGKHLIPRMKWARLIAAFYGLAPLQIQQSMEGFLFFCRLFFTTSKWKRAGIFAALRVADRRGRLRGLFANQKDNDLCRISSRNLARLLQENVQVAVRMAEELDGYWQADGTLSAWFDRTFSG